MFALLQGFAHIDFFRSNVLLSILGLGFCQPQIDVHGLNPSSTTWLENRMKDLNQNCKLRAADLDPNNDTGLAHLLGRMMAPLATRETDVGRLLSHPWLRYCPDMDIAQAGLPLFIRARSAAALATAPVDGSALARPSPGIVRPDAGGGSSAEGLFRMDLELVEADVTGVGPCWLVLRVGASAQEEWPWLRTFEEGGAKDGCVVTRVDGRGPEEYRDARGRPTLQWGGPYWSGLELAVRYCPGELRLWGDWNAEKEQVVVVRRTRVVHQDGVVWDPQRFNPSLTSVPVLVPFLYLLRRYCLG